MMFIDSYDDVEQYGYLNGYFAYNLIEIPEHSSGSELLHFPLF
jgi:hypothetical protein